jgi:hypothetical protein
MLGVVGEADEIAAVVLQELGVGAVELLGQGVAEPGNRLVSVAAVEIDPLSVEKEAVIGPELGTGDPEPDSHDICDPAVGLEVTFRPVEVWIVG